MPIQYSDLGALPYCMFNAINPKIQFLEQHVKWRREMGSNDRAATVGGNARKKYIF